MQMGATFPQSFVSAQHLHRHNLRALSELLYPREQGPPGEKAGKDSDGSEAISVSLD